MLGNSYEGRHFCWVKTFFKTNYVVKFMKIIKINDFPIQFFRRERCEQMLFKCQNDSAQAIRELKIDELMCMGVAKNRSLAKIALEDCRWNLNDAAAALIS